MVALCRRLVAAPAFDRLFLALIVANAIVLGLETYESLDGATLHLVNDVFLGCFVVELLIRIVATFPHPRDFFRNGWNVFDFVVVVAAFTPGIRENATLLRMARLLRIVRAVRFLPDMRVLTLAVWRSLPGIASLAVMTLLIVYLYGMLGWIIFHEHDPENYSSIGQAMITMFVLLTLENIPDYIATGQELSDWTVLFFISYALVASFLIFNLFIGVVVNSMEQAREIELAAEVADGGDADDAIDHERALVTRVQQLRGDLEALEKELIAGRGARTGREAGR